MKTKAALLVLVLHLSFVPGHSLGRDQAIKASNQDTSSGDQLSQEIVVSAVTASISTVVASSVFVGIGSTSLAALTAKTQLTLVMRIPFTTVGTRGVRSGYVDVPLVSHTLYCTRELQEYRLASGGAAVKIAVADQFPEHLLAETKIEVNAPEIQALAAELTHADGSRVAAMWSLCS